MEALETESDVEQKFVVPLLTNEFPVGLGYSLSDFRTKLDLRKVKLDKGNKSIYYFPDYLIILEGLPLIVIEVKKPGEDLQEGLREARLYATEINSSYPTDFNPCQAVVVTDGTNTRCCKWDSEQTQVEFKVDEQAVTFEPYFKFLQFLKKETVLVGAVKLKARLRKQTQFVKPVGLLGGTAIKNAIVPDNTFGVNISMEYRYLFNPETREERQLIAKNAYVESKRKVAHVAPIDRLIRATLPPSFKEVTQIQSTANPRELIGKLGEETSTHHVLLLIGSVGAGKSTFVDYVRDVALPEELKKRLYWLSINMNNAPTSRSFIYKWFLERAIEILESENQEYDFREFDTIKKIFFKEIADFDKGPIKLFDRESEKYKNELYSMLSALRSDTEKYFKRLSEFIVTSRQKSFIIVLDNVDKRDRDTQLLMFEVASWLKTSFRCLVFLPMREVTFDNYRTEPPLDTVVQDYIFRIEPPLLEQVLYKRMNFLLREINNQSKLFHYVLSNGARVECRREELLNYLGSILKSLFQNQFFKRLIIGLSGRDIRKGVTLFLNFCKSGHISEDDIFKMRTKNDVVLPNHIITRILLRGNRRYYSDLNLPPIRNLFHSYNEDTIPDPFIRLAILNWLKARYQQSGPSGIKGYFQIQDLMRDLICIGHSTERIQTELKELLKSNCIINESQDESIVESNLVSITPTGHVHLDLLTNIDCLSTVSEDTYFKDLQVAERIRDNIAGRDVSLHLNRQNSLINSELLIDYLDSYKNAFPFKPEYFLEEGKWTDLHDLTKSREIIVRAQKQVEISGNEKYRRGDLFIAHVTDVKNYGLFVEFELEASGFIHVSHFTKEYDPTYLEAKFEVGQELFVEVVEFSHQHGKYTLKPIK